MGKHKGGEPEYEYEEKFVKKSEDYKHLTQDCDGNFVQEGESGLHCPKCGCWPEIHNKEGVSV